MSEWPSTRARRVLAALLKIGWQLKRQSGSHRTLARANWPDFVFAFHDDEEDRAADVGQNCETNGPHARRFVKSRVDGRFRPRAPRRSVQRTLRALVIVGLI